ncbi:DoxX family protein [Dokdonia ponticola]|uniref:DoxX family protein n=1 Tax=Dokdonia ponticola TaxID=2041041 RepID=A0ABV9HWE5_9FLAO
MKIQKISYWIATLITCGIFVFSAQMYFRNTEMVEGFFEILQYPTYIVIPLAIAKVLGIVMVLWRGIPWLTEWAYAGLFFDAVLAFAAHTHANDGGYLFSLLILIFLPISYFLGKRIRPMYDV